MQKNFVRLCAFCVFVAIKTLFIVPEFLPLRLKVALKNSLCFTQTSKPGL